MLDSVSNIMCTKLCLSFYCKLEITLEILTGLIKKNYQS